MGDIDTINTIVNAGSSVIFLWLFWNERKRSQELSDQRVKIVEDCMDRLARQSDAKQNPQTAQE